MHLDSFTISEKKADKTFPSNCPPPPTTISLLRAFKLYKQKAFTLAETLIILTIIGIIAAITVPTLISKYQKHTYVVGLKKMHSELQNAVKMIPITEGCPAGDYDCAGITSTELLTTALSKQFKTQKICEIDSPDATECTPIFKTSPPKIYYHILLDDGTIIGTVNSTTIAVDTNGTKGPNNFGRDQFLFKLITSNEDGFSAGTIVPYGSKLHAMANDNDNAYWKNNNYCITENADRGVRNASYCTGRVLEEDAMNY